MKRILMIMAVLAIGAVAGVLLQDPLQAGVLTAGGGMVAATLLMSDPHLRLSVFAYPANAMVHVLVGDGHMIHDIWTPVNVSAVLTATDGTGYGNAPVGSRVTQYLAGSVAIYVKETDATWTTVT